MAKVYRNERPRKKVRIKKVLKGKKQERTIKVVTKRKQEAERSRQTRREERRIEETECPGGLRNLKLCFQNIVSNQNEKVIDKSPYSSKEALMEINNGKNDSYIKKKDKIKRYMIANNFRFMKGKILLLHYIKELILLILNMQINSSSYIELIVTGPGTSSVFFENKRPHYVADCLTTNFPSEVYINNISQGVLKNVYYLNYAENTVKLIFNYSVDLRCYFYLCSNITKIDFTHFDSSTLSTNHLGGAFNGCTSLTSINFWNINTSKIEYMKYMFANCKNLVSLNLSSFDTSNVITMEKMFENCSSLVSIDLFNTPTSKIITMAEIFKNCYSLASLDLSNFVSTDNLEYMGSAFYNCISLKYINISNLVTKKLKTMDNMFYNCSSLTSLNLSNFEFTGLVRIDSMFDGCSNLKYINLNNAVEAPAFKDINYANIFRGIPENIIICLKEEYTTILTSLIKTFTCPTIYCGDNLEQKQKQMINCELVCDADYPYELKEKHECVNYCDIDKILSGACITKYKGNANEEVNKGEKEKKEEEIKLQDKLLDNVEKGFTSDNYNTSGLDGGKDEVIPYNNMAITLTTTDNQKNNANKNVTTIDFTECENILRQKYLISRDKKLYLIKIDVKQEGLKVPKIEYDAFCKLNGTNLVKLDLSYCSNVKIGLSIPVEIKENLDKLNASSDYYNDICYPATSDNGTDIPLSDRKNEFVQNNITVCQESCDFTDYDYNTQKAKCSCKVKSSSNTTALMKINTREIFDSFKNFKNIANIVILKCYNILFSLNGIKRNYGFYMNIVIVILHFIFIIIFYRKYLSIIKEEIKKIIYGIKNWYLVKIEEKLKRQRELEKLKKEKLKKKRLKQEILRKQKKEKQEKERKLNRSKRRRRRQRNMISKVDEDQKEDKKDKKLEDIMKTLGPVDYYYYLSKYPHLVLKDLGPNPPKKKRPNHLIIDNNLNFFNINNNSNNNFIHKRNKNTKSNQKNQLQKKEMETIAKVKKIMVHKDDELNDMDYEEALRFDSRTYCEYYCSLIKTKNVLIYSFFYNGDYNAKIIKIDLFFVGFVIFFTINALFFNDKTMHKIYEDKGKFQILYQLPQIIYSSLISLVIDTILKLLAITDGDLLKLKNEKDKEEPINKIEMNQKEKDLKKN